MIRGRRQSGGDLLLLGGFLSWLSATRLSGLSAAAVSYCGGNIGNVAHEQARCAVLMHFGEKDHAIP